MIENVSLLLTKSICWAILFICALGFQSGGLASSVSLQDIDSGLTSPSGNYRWLNIADQQYADSYSDSYNYTEATVHVTYSETASVVRGVITATNLKPNFAYQIKLVGTSGTATNELIGLAGRWWQEEWGGSEWTNGRNLNNNGDGSSPNPNDLVYIARRDIEDTTSPTGKRYKYTGYLPFDFFVTDDYGNAEVEFSVDSCYHVFWKLSQRDPEPGDGPADTFQFDPELSSPAYDTDYDTVSIGVYGEWERLPVGGVHPGPGTYVCQLILTEESFHGSGGEHAGGWAAAMGAEIEFTVVPRLLLLDLDSGVCHLSWIPAGNYLFQHASAPDFGAIIDEIPVSDTFTDYYYDLGDTVSRAFFRLAPFAP